MIKHALILAILPAIGDFYVYAQSQIRNPEDKN